MSWSQCVLVATCVAVAALAGCGGGSTNPFEAEQLAGFIDGLDLGGEARTARAELTPGDVPDYVNDAGMARGWRAGERLQVLQPRPEFDRVLVQVELYADEEDARRRNEGEQEAFVSFVSRSFRTTHAESFDASDIDALCHGFTIESGAYIDQQQVHCQVETLVITARSITEDVEAGADLAHEAAADVVQRAQAALPAEDEG